MACIVTYTHPGTGERNEVVVRESLSIGRQPRQPGLVVAAGDLSVSRDAVEIRLRDADIWIANTGKYAPIELRVADTVRVLGPGDTATVTGSCVLTLPATDTTHNVTIEPVASVGPDTTAIEATAADSTQPIDERRHTWDSRLPTVAALCASRLQPDEPRWQAATPEDLAALLVAAGHTATAASVNADLRAVRDLLATQSNIRFVSRDDMAEHLVVNGLVGAADVERILMRDAQRDAAQTELADLVTTVDQVLLDPTPLYQPALDIDIDDDDVDSYDEAETLPGSADS